MSDKLDKLDDELWKMVWAHLREGLQRLTPIEANLAERERRPSVEEVAEELWKQYRDEVAADTTTTWERHADKETWIAVAKRAMEML